MKLIYGSQIFRLPVVKKYDAVCLGRLILFKHEPDGVSQILFNHEMVHQEQMDDHGVAGFYVRYFWYYLRGLIRYQSHDTAYLMNPFEKEAYNKSSSRS